MVDYINKVQNLKTISFGSSNKKKCMNYRGKLSSGILSYCRYKDLKKMKIVSCKIGKDDDVLEEELIKYIVLNKKKERA